mmetsp:Transcript_58676/g.126924  ORF Transcript_58676/g.126924 Transcript_58676/m.126924 type:complete len:219 (-) Transcript_58676:33-689(-)
MIIVLFGHIHATVTSQECGRLRQVSARQKNHQRIPLGWHSIADALEVLGEGCDHLPAVPGGLALLLVEKTCNDLAASAHNVYALLRPGRDDAHELVVSNLELWLVLRDLVLEAAQPEATIGRPALVHGFHEASGLIDRLFLGAHVVLQDILLVILFVDEAPASLSLDRGCGVESEVCRLRKRSGIADVVREKPLLDGLVPAGLLLGHCEKVDYWKQRR